MTLSPYHLGETSALSLVNPNSLCMVRISPSSP
jgi:hypothetical protein